MSEIQRQVKRQVSESLSKAISDSIRIALENNDFARVKEQLQNTVTLPPAVVETSKPAAQVERKVKRPVQYKYKVISPPGKAKGFFMRAGGVFLSAVFGYEFLARSFTDLYAGEITRFLTNDLLIFAPLAAGGLYLYWRGRKLKQAREDYSAVAQALSDNARSTLDRVAINLNQSSKEAVKTLRYMIKQGFFHHAFIDERNGMFVVGRDNVAQYRNHLVEEQAKQTKRDIARQMPGSPEAILVEGEMYLDQIRAVNRSIENPAVKEKLAHMERISDYIFKRVAGAPHKLPEIRRYMNYYLPTAVKLVQAYQDAERQLVQGQNILTTKRQIEESLDLVNTAFERLLDQLYEKDSMDIHSEISAMENMLRGDGLAGEDITK